MYASRSSSRLTGSTAHEGSTIGPSVMASNVKSCRFIYDPNLGATQQYGFVSLQLELARASEAVSLVFGAHVENAP